MAASEIREHKIDSAATVFFFERVYDDDLGSATAYDRARPKINARDNTSMFRVRTPDDGHQLLFVVSGTLANPERAVKAAPPVGGGAEMSGWAGIIGLSEGP
jgi:hypothetical protein